MENLNIGVAKLSVSNDLFESYLNNSSDNENKQKASDLLKIIKESDVLQLELKIFDNIENKTINNDVLATRYIDDNVKLFEIYTLEELNEERNKLKPFIKENISDDHDKINLYNAISTLIEESLKTYDETNVDNIYESFDIVLNHIKNNKKSLKEDNSYDDVNDEILEIAVYNLNEKYKNLSEEDKNLFVNLISADENSKKDLFENYIESTKSILENMDNTNIKINKCIEKLNNMKFDNTTVDTQIIELHELKKGLID